MSAGVVFFKTRICVIEVQRCTAARPKTNTISASRLEEGTQLLHPLSIEGTLPPLRQRVTGARTTYEVAARHEHRVDVVGTADGALKRARRPRDVHLELLHLHGLRHSTHDIVVSC